MEQIKQGFRKKELADLLRLSHNLAGTSATFGFTAISKAAKELEHSLEDIDSENSLNKDKTRINKFIDQLKKI